MPGKPLAGMTVVDLTRYLPGPHCTRLLADFGAAVVKIEPPGGDPMRTIAWYDHLNHGKRIVTLDLREPAAIDRLHELLADADVCVEGFKPSTARAIGVDGVALRKRYPSLVHCSISGYGQSGDDVERPGHDLNYQAEAGLLARRPLVPTMLAADITSALQATIAILAALVERGRTSAGAAIDISLFHAAAAWMPFAPEPILSGEYACYNVYETADGRHVALGALERKFWERFCREVGREDWIPRHREEAGRQDLVLAVQQLFRARRLAEWQGALAAADCCFSVVATA